MHFVFPLLNSLDDARQNFEQLEGLNILDASVPLTGAAWIAPTLINSWVNAGAPDETVGYLKDPLGFVHLKGLIKTGTSGTVAFVLPAGYLPGARTNHSAINGALSGALVQIAVSGNVTVFSAGAAANPIGLSGMTFLAEN